MDTTLRALVLLGGFVMGSCQVPNPAYYLGPQVDASTDDTLDGGSSADIEAAVGADPASDTASDSAPPTMLDAAPGEVTGTIRGKAFPVAHAFWIGLPKDASSTAVILVDTTTINCATLAASGWDSQQGDAQVMEMSIKGTAARVYRVGKDASVTYQRASTRPDANSGTITVLAITAGQSLKASFQLGFGADSVAGSFEAAYCANGVQP
jgi:hypothetical protein